MWVSRKQWNKLVERVDALEQYEATVSVELDEPYEHYSPYGTFMVTTVKVPWQGVVEALARKAKLRAAPPTTATPAQPARLV